MAVIANARISTRKKNKMIVKNDENAGTMFILEKCGVKKYLYCSL